MTKTFWATCCAYGNHPIAVFARAAIVVTLLQPHPHSPQPDTAINGRRRQRIARSAASEARLSFVSFIHIGPKSLAIRHLRDKGTATYQSGFCRMYVPAV
jgi:hypothetical protein